MKEMLAQLSIHLNKVACIKISQEQTVFKTKKQRSSSNFIYRNKNRNIYHIN
jgi:hypothetical protein